MKIKLSGSLSLALVILIPLNMAFVHSVYGKGVSNITLQDWHNMKPKDQNKLKEQILSGMAQKPVPVIINSAGKPLSHRVINQEEAFGEITKRKPQSRGSKIQTIVLKHCCKTHFLKLKNCCKTQPKNNCSGIGISEKDVNEHGAGFMISKPGKYFLKENIDFDPSVPGAAAIVINSDNVVLDLCDKTLRQEPGNTQPGTIGILVNGVQNVSIENGTIRDFNTFGIFANQGSDILSLNQLNVINCGTTAIGFVGGVFLLLSNSIEIKNSNFLENFGAAVNINGCTNFVMDSCSCDDTKGSIIFPFGTSAIGFVANPFPLVSPTAIPSENIVLTNNTFNRSVATFEAFGAIVLSFNSATEMKNILIENCVSMGSTGGAASDEVEGFGVVGSNVTVKNCVVDGVVSGVGTPNSGQARGFRFIGSNILCQDCVASNISGSGPIAAVGFSGEYTAQEITWRGCTAYNITNSGTPNFFGTADAYGFGTVIRGSFIVPLIFPSPLFNFNIGTGNIFESCIAENVTTTGGGTAAGFRFSSQQNIDVQNCISNNNGTYGFWFIDELGDPASSNGIIQFNTIEGNGVAGIEDTTLANNAYFSNYARSNDGPGSNYVGVPAGTPIAIWTIPGPVPTINPLDNLDIRP